MFNPEFRFLIAQENGEELLMQLMDHELFTKIFNTVMNMIITFVVTLFACKTTISIFMLVFPVLNYILTMVWNSLTPGNQLMELALIITTSFAFILTILTMNEMTNQLDNSFNKLREQCREKDIRIAELEAYVTILTNDTSVKNDQKNDLKNDQKNEKTKVL
jgi:Na+/alanine symporter